jgi:hypothetical protein
MTVLERIKQLAKEKKNISITTLEQELGYSNGSLSKAKDIPSSRIKDISDYLDVSMDFLMTGKDLEKYSPEQAKLIIEIRKDKGLAKALRRYFELSSEQKKHILDAIELFDKEKNNKND